MKHFEIILQPSLIESHVIEWLQDPPLWLIDELTLNCPFFVISFQQYQQIKNAPAKKATGEWNKQQWTNKQ